MPLQRVYCLRDHRAALNGELVKYERRSYQCVCNPYIVLIFDNFIAVIFFVALFFIVKLMETVLYDFLCF